MPLYDYECLGCGHLFELRQGFDSDPEAVCPHCAGVSRRKFHAVPIIYKGSGFYTTDYKGTGYSPATKEDKESADSKEKTESTAEKKTSEDKASAEKLVDKADAAKKAGAL